jgi:chlorite dismutase
MPAALSPATLEGWYALHQMVEVDWGALRAMPAAERARLAAEAGRWFAERAALESGGWSAAFRLVGGGADLMLIHLRPTLDELSEAELQVKHSALGPLLRPSYDYLSVTEAGMYHATATAAAEEGAGTEGFRKAIAEQLEAELASKHVQTRIYPRIPEGMRYVSFYPMNKRRADPDNWYTLPIGERNQLMRDHGLTGRRYAGRVFQVITGSVGFDDWEWGVTLFADDPIVFKKLIYEMRFDPASSRFALFGPFYVGIRCAPGELGRALGVDG